MHPMRRKDKERDAAFAWQVLRDATYATLAMTDSDGAPYCVPVNHVADEAGNAVYFHCAGAGRKWDILTKEPPVCLSAVSKAELIPGELTTAYKSALVQGRAVLVQDPEEKLYALKLLVQALDPVSMSRAVLCAEHSMQRFFNDLGIVREVIVQLNNHRFTGSLLWAKDARCAVIAHQRIGDITSDANDAIF